MRGGQSEKGRDNIRKGSERNARRSLEMLSCSLTETKLTICLATATPPLILKSPADLKGTETSLDMRRYCCPPLTSTGLENGVK